MWYEVNSDSYYFLYGYQVVEEPLDEKYNFFPIELP